MCQGTKAATQPWLGALGFLDTASLETFGSLWRAERGSNHFSPASPKPLAVAQLCLSLISKRQHLPAMSRQVCWTGKPHSLPDPTSRGCSLSPTAVEPWAGRDLLTMIHFFFFKPSLKGLETAVCPLPSSTQMSSDLATWSMEEGKKQIRQSSGWNSGREDQPRRRVVV